jgi:hypothetical protein
MSPMAGFGTGCIEILDFVATEPITDTLPFIYTIYLLNCFSYKQ